MSTTSSTTQLSRKPLPSARQSHHNSQDQSMMTIHGGPPMSNTRTSLPQIQSKFDLEPNPFEQSFKDNPSEAVHSTQSNTISPSLDHLLNGSRPRRARSSSPHHFTCHVPPTPPAIRQSPDSTLAKVSLPGINFITSPAILVHHHSGPNSTKSLNPLGLAASQSLESLRPPSMLAYPWNFGALGDSLRTGPLSPALLDGPAPGQSSQPVVQKTGLTPPLDSTAAITPGTQALLALLSGNEENNDIRSSAIQPLSTAASGASNNQNDHPKNVTYQVDQNLRTSLSTSTPASNPESLNAPNRRSAGPAFSSKSTMSSSSPFKDLANSSASVQCSPPSASRTLDPIKTNILSSRASLATVSSTTISCPSSSSSTNSLHAKSDFASNQCVQSSLSASLGPSVVKALHPISSLGLSQPALSGISSFPSSATTSRSSFGQPPIPLPIPPAPPMQSVTEITAPLSPVIASRSLITPLPQNPNERIDDQYNANPLYLLTVAHEASSRIPQLSDHPDALDDATATAAAALTGLGSSGGSRYSSPGPSIHPNGAMNCQLPVINNIHSSQSILMSHKGNACATTSPTLSSIRPNSLANPSSINPAILCVDNEPNLLSAHPAAPFVIERREQPPNGLLPEGTPAASGSTSQLSHQSSYPAHNLGLMGSTNLSDANGCQSFSSLDSSAAKKKSKKRKESGEIETETAERNDMGEPQLLRPNSHAQSSSPCVVGSAVSRSTTKATRTAATTHKTKKPKKSKTEDLSGDDSDSRDGYWGPEDDSSFMKQHGAEEVDSGGYTTRAHTNSNYYSNTGPTTTQTSSSGKPETEEEKRKSFLERNRQAALKCRQRKKAWLANLQTKIEFLSTENESLQLTINRLRAEIDSFRNILTSHKDCPINLAGGRGASTTIGDLMGRDPGFVAANAAAVLTQQHHEVNERIAMRHPPGPNSLHGQTHIAATLSSTNGPIRRSHHNSHGAVASTFGY